MNLDIKYRAHLLTRKALNKGMLNKQHYCTNCKLKTEKIVAHHPDYTKPLEVIWLCNSCHRLEHGRINTVKKGRPESMTTLFIDKRIKYKLKTIALKKKITLQKLVEEIFTNYLKEDKK